jgi:hypothetical protein
MNPNSETAGEAIEELIGKRCATKDTHDFPDLKDNERCFTCALWDAIDQHKLDWLNEIMPEKETIPKFSSPPTNDELIDISMRQGANLMIDIIRTNAHEYTNRSKGGLR